MNKAWLNWYNMAKVLYLNLYIFADKCSFHQVRDDIMTAMLGQAKTWFWYNDPTETLISTAYDKLPSSVKFRRWIVIWAAHLWLTEAGEDVGLRLRSLHEW
jgi:hypothetical protein